RVLLVADAYECRFQQLHNGRDDLLARKPFAVEIGGNPAAQPRQGPSEYREVLELGALAMLAIARVISVLLPTARIAPGRLQVSVRPGADPHVGPRGRDSQRANTRDGGCVTDGLSVT